MRGGAPQDPADELRQMSAPPGAATARQPCPLRLRRHHRVLRLLRLCAGRGNAPLEGERSEKDGTMPTARRLARCEEAPEGEPKYSYASLNEHLSQSLTRSIRRGDRKAVARILMGWVINLGLFLACCSSLPCMAARST